MRKTRKGFDPNPGDAKMRIPQLIKCGSGLSVWAKFNPNYI